MPERSTKSFHVDNLAVKVFENRDQMGKAAAAAVVDKIALTMQYQQQVRMIFAAAPSQNEVLQYLVSSQAVEWSRITAYHMDEYLGLPLGAPQSFGHWLKDAIFSRVPFHEIHYLDPVADEPRAECSRYSALLAEAPIDIVCLGIGENGHIAFNDPPVADFIDPELVKVVELEEPCRRQQVNDGAFASLKEVPVRAITLTVPALISAKHLICTVPGPTKADAVYRTLYGAIDTECPASIMRRHDSAALFLDLEAAAQII